MLEIKYRLNEKDKSKYIEMVRERLPKNIDGIYNAVKKDKYNKRKKKCQNFKKTYDIYKDFNDEPYIVKHYSDELKKLLNELKLAEKYIDMNFDKWICLEYEEIRSIQTEIDKLKEKDRSKYGELCGSFGKFKDYYEKFSADGKYGKVNEFIVRVTNCKVCSYCNINYTYTRGNEVAVSDSRSDIISKIKKVLENGTITHATKNNIKPKVTAQLDHFFSKNEYPMFALCFYNLIPSCGPCNNVKSTLSSEKMISPYDSEFFSKLGDSNPVFSYTGDIKNLKIEINEDLRCNSAIFLLEDAYKNHVDEMKDIIRTAEIYCDENFKKGYRKLLEDISYSEKLSDNDFINFICKTIVYENDKDKFSTRSLSKCKSDVFKQAVSDKQNCNNDDYYIEFVLKLIKN